MNEWYKESTGMEKGSLYSMFKHMILTAEDRNDKAALKTIKAMIDLTPMKYFMFDAITTSQANYLQERIALNLWEGEEK